MDLDSHGDQAWTWDDANNLNQGRVSLTLITHLFPMHPFSTSWKQKTVKVFWCFLGVKKKVHWEQNGLNQQNHLYLKDFFWKKVL